MRDMQSHEVIDTIEGSACCLLCGTLEDPFVGCEHRQDMLFASMEGKSVLEYKLKQGELDMSKYELSIHEQIKKAEAEQDYEAARHLTQLLLRR